MDSTSTYPPMHPDQIEFFSEQETVAARRASRRTLRAALGGYVILFAGVLALYLNGQAVSEGERQEIRNDGRVVAIQSCNGRFTDRVELREILMALQASVESQYERGLITKADRTERIVFYQDRIDKLPLPDCRKSDDALETNEAEVPLPVARYPGDGK